MTGVREAADTARARIVEQARVELAKADETRGSVPWAVRALLETIDERDAVLAAAAERAKTAEALLQEMIDVWDGWGVSPHSARARAIAFLAEVPS